MAVYKVPQDVEADDKLIGPFSFRQFVYLLIAAGLVALAVALFQIFPLLAIIPVPFVLFFLALALPLKKDQPMETYLAALVSYYLKPRTKRWMPGQRESAILITAPKIVEEVRTRDISGEEATSRLSFLADIVDSQGYAIRGGMANSNMRDDLVAEANATADMFDNYNAGRIGMAVQREAADKRQELINNMRAAIERNETNYFGTARVIDDSTGEVLGNDKTIISSNGETLGTPVENPVEKVVDDLVEKSVENQARSAGEGAVQGSDMATREATVMATGGAKDAQNANENSQKSPKDSIMELVNNADFSVATIAKEANRIKRKDEGEVFISLH